MASDDRPKLSWREIDKRRDSVGHGANGGGRSGLPPTQEEARQKQYRAALEAAFEKGELGKLADKLNLTTRNGSAAPSGSATAGASAATSTAAANAPAVSSSGSAQAPDSSSTATADAKAAAGKKKVVGKLAEDRTQLRKKLVEAIGRGEITRAADKFLLRFPLPDDHEVLEQLLEHERESRISEAITRIAQLLDRQHVPKRSRALCGKLRYIVETTHDAELKQAAQGLLVRLS
ncbi:MAG: hypothetical protein JNJ46_22780 [Myxococcales bacterium]|nr:hypothetical protein [Myxococcales bacterium]